MEADLERKKKRKGKKHKPAKKRKQLEITPFDLALQLLQSKEKTVVGRDDQRAQITSFLKKAACDELEGAKCMYISGAPGTGKTSMIVNEILPWADHEISQKITIVYRNCMELRAEELFNVLLDETNIAGKGSALEKLERYWRSGQSKKILLVADEIDSWLKSRNKTLYQLFEWTNYPNSSLILVGIANTLNMIDEYLPHLRKINVHFPTYSKEELQKIMQERLNNHNGICSKHIPITEDALGYCAHIVSNQFNGDVRKALGMLCKAVELAEIEYNSKKNLDDDTVDAGAATNANEIPCEVDLHHVRLANRPSSLHLIELLLKLPMEQKRIMAALVKILSNENKKALPDVKKLKDAANTLKGIKLNSIDLHAELLKSQGLVVEKNGKINLHEFLTIEDVKSTLKGSPYEILAQ